MLKTVIVVDCVVCIAKLLMVCFQTVMIYACHFESCCCILENNKCTTFFTHTSKGCRSVSLKTMYRLAFVTDCKEHNNGT